MVRAEVSTAASEEVMDPCLKNCMHYLDDLAYINLINGIELIRSVPMYKCVIITQRVMQTLDRLRKLSNSPVLK